MSEIVKSPCVSVCALNDNDVCVGCYRTANEVSQWSSLDNSGKQAVMERVRERAAELNQHGLL